MKTLCSNRTPEKQVIVCKRVRIMLLVFAVLYLGVTISDMIQGRGIDASRNALFCSTVCTFSLNERRMRAALEEIEG